MLALTSVAAGAANVGAPPAASDLTDYLAAIQAIAHLPVPNPYACQGLPAPLPTPACAGAQRYDTGPDCQGGGATEYAFHEIAADVTVGDQRVGAFLFCSDQPGYGDPDGYYTDSVAIIGHADGTTAGPVVVWFDFEQLAYGATYHGCWIDLIVDPLPAQRLDCPGGLKPPRPPGLPA